MDANLTKWFGESIYISKVKDFEKINKKIVPYIKNNVSPTNSQYATTTDVKPKALQDTDDNLQSM